MVTKAQAERMLSEEERALLVQCARGPDAYPVVELGGKWTWEYGPLGAPETTTRRPKPSTTSSC
jgi:hypothetical protein